MAAQSRWAKHGHDSATTGSDCQAEAMTIAPIVDRTRCEAKGECVAVCPFGVFELGTLTSELRASLPLIARIRAWAHGNRQAFVQRPADCHACARCVAACPERAITLAPVRFD